MNTVNTFNIVHFVETLLLESIEQNASDIHLEPFVDYFQVRHRRDGILQRAQTFPLCLADPITARIKVLAHLSPLQKKIPQQGHFQFKTKTEYIDIRVSTLPIQRGESVVLRILNKRKNPHELNHLGMPLILQNRLREWVKRSHGLLIVTGPTGSGKTTTLYSLLQEINDPTIKILTAEDPIEYSLSGIVQTETHQEIGLSFSHLLRSLLRQDPDKIMIGEIRDEETAHIALQAALTGHLVLTTLHASDAPSAILRLLDLGTEPYLMVHCIMGIVGQRLIRVQCKQTGCSGRRGLFSLLELTPPLCQLIYEKASLPTLKAQAKKDGMKTLEEMGLIAVAQGLITQDELCRQI